MAERNQEEDYITDKYFALIEQSKERNLWSPEDLDSLKEINAVKRKAAKQGDYTAMLKAEEMANEIYKKYGVKFPWWNN